MDDKQQLGENDDINEIRTETMRCLWLPMDPRWATNLSAHKSYTESAVIASNVARAPTNKMEMRITRRTVTSEEPGRIDRLLYYETF